MLFLKIDSLVPQNQIVVGDVTDSVGKIEQICYIRTYGITEKKVIFTRSV